VFGGGVSFAGFDAAPQATAISREAIKTNFGFWILDFGGAVAFGLS